MQEQYHSQEEGSGASDYSQQQRRQQLTQLQLQQQQPHYSSQDSLPDSPYSSQSLDSQPVSNAGACQSFK